MPGTRCIAPHAQRHVDPFFDQVGDFLREGRLLFVINEHSGMSAPRASPPKAEIEWWLSHVGFWAHLGCA